MSDDLKDPANVLRYLLRRGEGGGWYACAENVLTPLPHWLWPVCEHHIPSPRPIESHEKESPCGR